MNYISWGTVRRCWKSPDSTKWIWVPVIKDSNEGRYHRVLPESLVKFKHYGIETIAQALNGDQDLDLHDLPSDSSISRWKKLAYELLKRKSELKHSDLPDLLPEPLHDNPNSGRTVHVENCAANKKYEPRWLAELFMLAYSK